MKNKNKMNIEPMDERQSQITQKSIVVAFLFLVLCLLLATIYKIAKTGEAGWELFAMIGASMVVLISRRVMGDVEQPLDYKNRPLPTGNTKPERMARIKNYVINSVVFGATFGVMDIIFLIFAENEVSEYKLTQVIFPNLTEGLTLAITAVLAFAIMFTVSFVFEYLVGEFFKVRRYNKMIAELESEE